MVSCCFCDEVESGPNQNFAARYPEVASRILWTDGKLFAMPCIGQLQPNHFMIMPVMHSATLREAAQFIDRLDERIGDAISNLLPRLGVANARSLVFEHGARDPQDGGCGIYHAHLHVVPVSEVHDLPSILNLEFTRQGRSLADVFAQQTFGDAYALAGYWGESLGLANLPGPLPSQYMRRQLSAALGITQWDWRKSGRESAVLAALSSMQHA